MKIKPPKKIKIEKNTWMTLVAVLVAFMFINNNIFAGIVKKTAQKNKELKIIHADFKLLHDFSKSTAEIKKVKAMMADLTSYIEQKVPEEHLIAQMNKFFNDIARKHEVILISTSTGFPRQITQSARGFTGPLVYDALPFTIETRSDILSLIHFLNELVFAERMIVIEAFAFSPDKESEDLINTNIRLISYARPKSETPGMAEAEAAKIDFERIFDALEIPKKLKEGISFEKINDLFTRRVIEKEEEVLKVIEEINVPLYLTGILFRKNPKKSIAVVNSHLLKEGEEIEGWMIEEINEDDVKIKKDDKRAILTLAGKQDGGLPLQPTLPPGSPPFAPNNVSTQRPPVPPVSSPQPLPQALGRAQPFSSTSVMVSEDKISSPQEAGILDLPGSGFGSEEQEPNSYQKSEPNTGVVLP